MPWTTSGRPQLFEVLDDTAGKRAVADLVKQWTGLNELQSRYEQYCAKHAAEEVVERKNSPAPIARDLHAILCRIA